MGNTLNKRIFVPVARQVRQFRAPNGLTPAPLILGNHCLFSKRA